MALDQKLLEILVCPKCKSKVAPDKKGENLVCAKCRLSYEVRDGIPIMLVSEAKPLAG
ncbi:MAG: Trm112 family protein [Thermodesulfobacteriota bacterium]